MSKRILVATDGSPGALGALRIARLLAERDGSEVEVLTVYEPPPLYPVEYNVSVPDPELDRYRSDAQLRGVRAQVREVTGQDHGWEIHARIGAVAPAIARQAAEGNFSRILLGIGHHRPLDRWLGSETVLRLIQLAHVPVLAVQPDVSELPRRALVAMDFSDLSIEAARACLSMLWDAADVHLVHASWIAADHEKDNGREAGSEWVRTYEAGIRARLDDLARELGGRDGVAVRTSVVGAWVGNDVARVLLETARHEGAELIAAGSHGLGFFGRVLMGSVSTKLLRGAGCSVLVVPPREIPEEIGQISSAGVS